MPKQELREKAVIFKLSPIIKEIKGREILIIDDSIVRGTTSRKIVEMLRKAGASKVHFGVSCPPIKKPCYYGIDMSTEEELIASNKSIEEIKNYINADSLIYQNIDDLKKAIGLRVCTGCLNGNYPTDILECGKDYSNQRKQERLVK